MYSFHASRIPLSPDKKLELNNFAAKENPKRLPGKWLQSLQSLFNSGQRAFNQHNSHEIPIIPIDKEKASTAVSPLFLKRSFENTLKSFSFKLKTETGFDNLLEEIAEGSHNVLKKTETIKLTPGKPKAQFFRSTVANVTTKYNTRRNYAENVSGNDLSSGQGKKGVVTETGNSGGDRTKVSVVNFTPVRPPKKKSQEDYSIRGKFKRWTRTKWNESVKSFILNRSSNYPSIPVSKIATTDDNQNTTRKHSIDTNHKNPHILQPLEDNMRLPDINPVEFCKRMAEAVIKQRKIYKQSSHSSEEIMYIENGTDMVQPIYSSVSSIHNDMKSITSNITPDLDNNDTKAPSSTLSRMKSFKSLKLKRLNIF